MKKAEVQPGYRKGDNKAGGGGSRGGGGKRQASPYGWEKGDVVRDVADARPEISMPHKPGRGPELEEIDVEHHDASHGLRTVFDELRRTNVKILQVLRKLEDTAVTEADRRLGLVESVASLVRHKREIEADLFLVVGDEAAQTDVVFCRELGLEIDDQLSHLVETAPQDDQFAFAVRSLHGTLEHQIGREHSSVIPEAERVMPLDQAIALAHH